MPLARTCMPTALRLCTCRCVLLYARTDRRASIQTHARANAHARALLRRAPSAHQDTVLRLEKGCADQRLDVHRVRSVSAGAHERRQELKSQAWTKRQASRPEGSWYGAFG
eukprot:1572271-Pleurochrysis_carterae.AAC.7